MSVDTFFGLFVLTPMTIGLFCMSLWALVIGEIVPLFLFFLMSMTSLAGALFALGVLTT